MRDRAARKTTDNMAAYECVVTAKLLHHRSRREDNARAQELIARAIELDPQYAHAHAWRACILGQASSLGWRENQQATMAEIETELSLALALDDNESDVHRVAAALALMRNEFDKMLYHQQRALGLNPNDDLIVVQQGEVLTWIGRGEEGIEWIRTAMRLNPFHPDRFWAHLGRACFVARRYTEGVEAVQHISEKNEQHLALLAACYAGAGSQDAAAACVRDAQALVPGFSMQAHVLPFLHYRNQSDLAHHREALQKAGFQE